MIIAMLKFSVKNLLIDRGYGDSETIQKMNDFVYGDNPGTELDRISKISVKWAELYPFEAVDEQETKRSQISNPFDKVTGKIVEKLDGMKGQVSYYFDTGLFLKKDILEAGTAAEYALQWGLPESVKANPYVFWGGKTGHITSCKREVDVTNGAHNLSEFAKWTQEQGIDFLYVQYPDKMSGINESLLPEGFTTYADKNADELLAKLEENNIPYKDIRSELMPDDSENLFELFFRTDHHWLPQTGVFVGGILAEHLQECGVEINTELFEADQYKVETYEDIFLGSFGRNVTAGMIEPDDFYVVTPGFETSLRVSIPNLGFAKEGSLEETLLDKNMLYMNPSYVLSQYEVYLHGDCPLIEIENLQTDNSDRVLIIKDSYSNVVVPYLSLGLKEVAVIDLRHFTGSLKSYVKEYNPNRVIVAYYPGTVEDMAYINETSHTSAWDFR